MSLGSALDAQLGICSRQTLRAAGATDSQLRALVAAGALVPIGRRLLARPDAKPELRRAAAMGARLACLSAARLRGLWVADEERGFHVSVASNASRFVSDDPSGVRTHWTRHPLDGADLPALESGRNMLLHVAQCQPLDLAVATFDSALNKGLISIEELRLLAGVRGGRFRRVVEYTNGLADSGLESVMRVRLSLRGVECRLQVRLDGHPVDLLIGSRLVIQADGFGPHSSRVQHDRDLAQDRRLKLRGYTVLRYPYTEIMFRWETVEAEILAAMAQRAHLEPGRHSA